MNTRYAGTDTDDAPRHPQRTGDEHDEGDTRRLAPDVEDGEDEEAGYGYGV